LISGSSSLPWLGLLCFLRCVVLSTLGKGQNKKTKEAKKRRGEGPKRTNVYEKWIARAQMKIPGPKNTV
jgi:hypothetical protein